MQAGAQPISWVSLAGLLQWDWGRAETAAQMYELVITDRLAKQ